MTLLFYLIAFGIPAWYGFGMWCMGTGRVNVTIADATGDEPSIVKLAMFVGAAGLVTWLVVRFYLTGGDWPDEY